MVELFTDGLFFPALALALLAWMVPKLMSMILGEGVKRLLLNALLSTVCLFALSGGFFFFLYLYQGVPLSELNDLGVYNNITFFGRLGLIAGFIWAPIMIVSVAALPRHWTKETW